ncbi:hypothetical protein GCN74_22310 [Janthinobacterium sp. FT14W]|nr:hypothetical protein GCN74_22310 [Janthinobacterium sp. FT14W]
MPGCRSGQRHAGADRPFADISLAAQQPARRQARLRLRSMPERIVIDCLGADPASAMLAQIQPLLLPLQK